jgi:hypothetical protein
MEKRHIQIAVYDVTQLNETEYEAENKELSSNALDMT